MESLSSRTVIGLVMGVLLFVTVATLYATGPGTKLVACEGFSSLPSNLNGGNLLRPAGLRTSNGNAAGTCVYQRTNAWERLKGAITGSP
jgi:hypothetical protein